VIAKCDMSRASRPGEGFTEQARVVRAAAQRHGLRHGYDEIGEPIIPGKRGHLYLDGDQWCWALVPERGHAPWSRQLMTYAKRDSRLEILVEGDEEAIFAVRDEADLRAVALRWPRCRRRMQLSDEERARRAERARRLLGRRPRENEGDSHPDSPITPSCDSDDARPAADEIAPDSVPVATVSPESGDGR
jgi:hypothetical protein